MSLFILGFFCNIFVYIAVEGYKTFPLALGKYLAIFVGITVFIMSGYEHSVADMFYYFMAGQMDQEALVAPLGNHRRQYLRGADSLGSPAGS